MGGLAHYIEAGGISTVGISLIREHTEAIQPPRALWVPFPLGRPFGVPHDRDFQMDVLYSLLAVLEETSGPVIVDYERDVPSEDIDIAWACALPLPPLPEADGEAERLAQGIEAEVNFLLPWHAEFARRNGRTLYGLANLRIEDAPRLGTFLAAFAVGETPPLPEGTSGTLPTALRPIIDDLKTLYLEAASVQPARGMPDPYRLNGWLYRETRLGDLLYRVRDRLSRESEAAPSDAGPPAVAIIPNLYRNRGRN